MTRTLATLLPLLAFLGLTLGGLSVSAGGSHSNLQHRRDGPFRSPPRYAVRAGRGGKLHRRADGQQCVKKWPVAGTPSSVDGVVKVPSSAVSSSKPAVAQSSTRAATTTPPPAATTPPTSNGAVLGGTTNVGSKMGLAWPNGEWKVEGDPGYLGNYIGTKTSWLYTWGSNALAQAETLGIEFVPMLWGPQHTADWRANQAGWSENTKNALFFNEPDLYGTEVASGISVEDSLQYWINDYLPVRASRGMQLGGAGPSNGPNGLKWVLDFVDVCKAAGHPAADCTPDFAPVHFYITNLESAQNYIRDFHEKTGQDVWVTEYACADFAGYPATSPPMAEIVDYNKKLVAWMDEQDYVVRYAPFGTMAGPLHGVPADNRLMAEDGVITDLGKWYID